MDGFVHLHVHSEYSLLDGAARLGDLPLRAAELGMTALALTDHGNLFGAMEFVAACKSAHIKPILGMEAYISPTHRGDRSMGNPTTAAYHMILLAANRTGWQNLIKLSSRSYLEGFYYRPRIDRQLLAEFNDGLICTTACLGGEVPSALLANHPQQAERIAREYLEIFGPERFFIELQNQGIPEQNQVNPLLVELAKKLGVGIVGTNDVHFLNQDDKAAHEVLTAISTGKTLAEGGAMSYSPHLYLKSPQQMRQSMEQWPEAADNTLRIAELCQVDLSSKGKHFPAFPTPAGQSDSDYLRQLAQEGLGRRFAGKDVPEEYRKRLDWELSVIRDKGFCSYFLIVHDFVNFARRNNIPAGPRGSGVGTLLGWVLGIGEVDPIPYGLLFERFTDPQRKEAPDMDIDMCQEGRGRVIQYVREKYGHVAQIITFGTLKARAVVRDVGRVLGMPLAEVDAIAKKVPEALNMTLAKALESESSLREMIEKDARVRELFEHARKLEGLSRHMGVHAAGVIIAQEPLENLLPLCKQSDSDDPITQWDGPTCDKIGLLKMDFLGLRTLTVLQRARELVLAQTGQDIDPEKVPLNDDRVYELFRSGQTAGVFQFESGGMQDLLKRMRPDRIEDLIAANAMYRPGPMELIPAYCARKHGLEKVPGVHSLVDDILAETHGIMVYQEQVMQVLNRLGRLPLNRALTLIKAISKKKHQDIAAEKDNFLAGAAANGISPSQAQELFDLILKFAGYGFNKSHSTRYAIIAYQTAYFKARHPQQFMAALLTFESGDTDKVVEYMAEAAQMGISIGAPNINACGADFTVDGQTIRFGLAAVKGVGQRAVEAIIQARKEAGRFRDLFHFCESVDLKQVNRTAIDALVKCGAFDGLGAHRGAMLAAVDHAMEVGNTAADDRRSGQMSLGFGSGGFGMESFGGQPAPANFPSVEPLAESQLLQFEKETLGFYVTSHPLVKYGRQLDHLGSVRCASLKDAVEGAPAVLGCMIAAIRQRITKSGRSAGQKMAILTVEDLTGSCECVVFSETYEKLQHLLREEAILFLVGKVDRRRETPQIIVEDAVPIEKAVETLTGGVLLRLAKSPDRENLQALGGLLGRHRGRCPLLLEVQPASRDDVRVVVKPSAGWLVAPSRDLYDQLCGLLGQQNVVLMPKKTNGNGNGRRTWPSRPSQRTAFAEPGQGPG